MRCPFPFSRVPPFLLVSISYAPLPFFGIVFFSPFSSPPFSSGKQHMFGDEKKLYQYSRRIMLACILACLFR